MEGMHGQILPVRDGVRPAEIYSEAVLCGPEQTALTGDDYKIIYHPYASAAPSKFEIYDRSSDRREQRNLAGRQPAAELQDRLRARTEAAQAAAIRWHRSETGGTGEFELAEEAK